MKRWCFQIGTCALRVSIRSREASKAWPRWAALVATWLIHFVFVWEWYLWPITIMRRDDGQLAQVAISGLVDPLRASDYALVFAAAVVTVLPAFVVFALLQRFLTATNATSGGK